MSDEREIRIIVVDDDSYVLDLIATFLKKRGYSLTTFSNGLDALEYFGKHGADIILTDVVMPTMSGGELLKNVHLIDPDVPVILMTGHVNLDNAIDAIKRGAFDFIVKPFDFETLTRSIEKGGQFRMLCLFKKEYEQNLEKALAAKTEELKEAHGQMVLSEKMASIGLLSAGVAHEINNPVTYISSNLCSMRTYILRIREFMDWQAKAIEEHCPSDVIDEHEKLRKSNKIEAIVSDMSEIVDDALGGVEHIKKIVASLRTFSRNDSDTPVATDLNELIERAITIVWHEVKYVATIEKKLGEMNKIVCFPSELSQVVMNLLVNAAHAMDKKPGVIPVQTWVEKDHACISVSDNGTGISPENINNIFTPFFTTKEPGKGTGLGLSISYEIIKKHNGEIKVETAPGVGSTFTIVLPFNLHQ